MTDHDDAPIESEEKKSNSDDRTMAMLCHLGGIIGFVIGFVIPLIIWLIKKDQSKFVDHHGKEAINFHLTMLIAHVAAGATFCFTFGILNLAVWVVSLIFSIIAAMAANRGEMYKYPMTIRFIS
jgi:uncharacterized Tic20 family protein